MIRAEAEHKLRGDPKRTSYEACVGYAALDPLGRKIGTVERLFTNGYGEPEYVLLKAGLLWMRPVLIPVEAVHADAKLRSLTLCKR